MFEPNVAGSGNSSRVCADASRERDLGIRTSPCQRCRSRRPAMERAVFEMDGRATAVKTVRLLDVTLRFSVRDFARRVRAPKWWFGPAIVALGTPNLPEQPLRRGYWLAADVLRQEAAVFSARYNTDGRPNRKRADSARSARSGTGRGIDNRGPGMRLFGRRWRAKSRA